MPSELTKVAITLMIFFNHLLQSNSQDPILTFIPLPLGQFRFITPFSNFRIPPSGTTTQSSVPFAFLDRPRLDTSVPAGVDAASIKAQDEAIEAFINACPREMRLAWLKCPCAHPGGRCADPYSVCSLENKCMCNGKLGYPNSTGKNCVPYVTSIVKPTTATTATRSTTATTTKTPTPTLTTTTKTTSTSTTTTQTTSTTTGTSTTATTTTTTTPVLVVTKIECTGTTSTYPPPVTLTTTDIIEITSDGYATGPTQTAATCLYSYLPPVGKSLKIEFVDLDVPSTLSPTACDDFGVTGSIPDLAATFCNNNCPLSTYTAAVDEQMDLSIVVDPTSSFSGQSKVKLRITVV